MKLVYSITFCSYLHYRRNALVFDTSVKSNHPICFQKKKSACRNALKWLFLFEMMRKVSPLRIREIPPQLGCLEKSPFEALHSSILSSDFKQSMKLAIRCLLLL